MYFSLAKRKLFSRAIYSVLSLCIFWLVLYSSPWAQESICPSPRLGSICFGIEVKSRWNLFYHLGGNGPWISRAPEGEVGRLPMKCEVEQVHIISRHAERFPTKSAGARHIALLDKLKVGDIRLTGSLAFVNDWKYFTNLSNPDFEDLTTDGPYAGTLQAYNTGSKLRKQYNQLVDSTKTTNYWSSSSSRDVETARHFGDGFFGLDWEEQGLAKLHIIPETADRGGDTLTPGDTCLLYRTDEINGHDRGYGELGMWQNTFSKPIIERLKIDAAGLLFTPIEIYSMMEMCGFEILAKGGSPWCDVFSHEEWLDFEYGRDLLHFYRAGPGNDFAGAMGWLWLNATTSLLANNTTRGIYLSFVHDGDIVPLLATLGILDESTNAGFLPNDKRQSNRKWTTSDVVPMGGRLVFEKVTCTNTGLGGNLRRSYVRLFINDGVVDLEKSMIGSGLANSIGMKQWVDMVRKKGEQFGSFRKVCGLPEDAPEGITFLQPQYQ